MKRKTLFCIFALLMLAACGKKGEPTLTTFVKPPPVKNITVVHRENSLLLSWYYTVPPDMQELVKGFYIEKAVGAGDNNPAEFRKAAFLRGNVNHYADTDFEVGRPYFYKIRVSSVRDIISDPSPVVKVLPAALPPPPQGLFFEVKNSALEIRWNKVPGKVKYNVYRSKKQNVFSEAPLNKTALSEPLFMDKVETGSPSYYEVAALLDTDIKDEGFPSKVLEVDPDTFVPVNPSGLKYVYAPIGVVLMWKENPEPWVKQYRIYRKRAMESSYSIIGVAVTPTFKDNESVTSETLYYITAVGPSRESAPSEPIEVGPLVER